MQNTDLIPGSPLSLGRAVLICPALNIKGMRAFKEELSLLEKGVPAEKADDKEVFNDFITKLAMVTHAALRRNYPNIGLDEVEEGIDLNNVRKVVQAVLGASGYVTTSESEAKTKLFGDGGTVALGESTGTS